MSIESSEKGVPVAFFLLLLELVGAGMYEEGCELVDWYQRHFFHPDSDGPEAAETNRTIASVLEKLHNKAVDKAVERAGGLNAKKAGDA